MAGAASGAVTVSGKVDYIDENGQSPLKWTKVELYNDNTYINETNTSQDGSFNFNLNSGMTVNFKVICENPAAKVIDENGNTYSFSIGDYVITDDPNTWDIGTIVLSSDYGQDEWKALFYAWKEFEWLDNKVGWWSDPKMEQIIIEWPKGNHPYVGNDTGRIYLPDGTIEGQEWDKTTIYHEYAHAVMYLIYGHTWPPHQSGSHEVFIEYIGLTDGSVVLNNPGHAFMEGWAEFMECAVENKYWNKVENSPGDSDDDGIPATAKLEFNYSTNEFEVNWTNELDNVTSNIEKNEWWKGGNYSNSTPGDIVEGAVASIFWDIFDSDPDPDRDDIQEDFAEIWSIMRNDNPNDINEFWTHWFSTSDNTSMNYGYNAELWEIYNENGIRKPDYNPPTSQVNPLPSTISTISFVVSWSGSDDLSGIKWYDIEYKEGDSGTWTTKWEGTTLTSNIFTGQNDTTYYFRSRAVDNADQVEAFPSSPDYDTFTTINVGTAQPGHDVGLFDVDWKNPDESDINVVTGEIIEVVAGIENYGTYNETNIPVQLVAKKPDNSESVVDEAIITQELAPGESWQVTLTWNTAGQQEGYYDLTVKTALSTDIDTSNDVISRQTYLSLPPNNPPNVPSNPTPSNGASNQTFNPTLGWSGGDPDGDTVTYNVYLDTNPNPSTLKYSGTSTSYSISGLSHETTYYWKVIASDGKYIQTSPIWRFTTKIAEVCPSGCDYTSIQAAINAANSGNTIKVHSGTYNENVNVNKQLILQGVDTGSGQPVLDPGYTGNAFTLNANGITIENFGITSGQMGIQVLSDSNNILGNNISDAGGIKLEYSSNNHITNNIVEDNGYGIYLLGSTNNSIIKNNFNLNGDGIYLDDSNYNNITNNNASHNDFSGIYLIYSSNNNITGNNADYNEVYGIYLYADDFKDSHDNNITGNSASFNENGIYLESIYGGNFNNLTGNNASYNYLFGIDLDYSNYCIIAGNIVNNNKYGIYLEDSSYNTLRNNVISGNVYNFGDDYPRSNNIDTSNLVDNKPIYYLINASDYVIDSSSNAGVVYCINCENIIVKDLTFTNNSDAIYFYNTNNSRIQNVNASFNEFGISLSSSRNNTLKNNNMFNNQYNFGLYGGWNQNITSYIHDIDITNLVNGKPIYYLFNKSRVIIDSSSNAGTIYCIACENVTIKDLTLTNNSFGVFFSDTINSTIQNITTKYNRNGISLDYSNHNQILNSYIHINRDGIELANSDHNNITSNNISNNEVGLNLWYSNDNLIQINNVSNNKYGGIDLYISDFNFIEYNNASNNGIREYWQLYGSGISLDGSNFNTIFANTAYNNSAGIILDYDSSSNILYLNNIFENIGNNASDSGNNQWYWGTTGNYYSDYTGTDSDGDGIGDTPYNISGGSSKDNYPFMDIILPSGKSGDFSGDGTTDSWDITYLARSITGIPGYETLSSGDVSGDDVVDAWDCTYMARAIAGVPGYGL